jgi:hypothetical protein
MMGVGRGGGWEMRGKGWEWRRGEREEEEAYIEERKS